MPVVFPLPAWLSAANRLETWSVGTVKIGIYNLEPQQITILPIGLYVEFTVHKL
jgi:hypothetical protein